MRQQFQSRLTDAFSAERLRGYLARCRGDVNLAWRLYAWNIAISSAFHGPLHCLEVVLRNAIHRELTAHFGRADWWDSGAVPFTDKCLRKIDNAKCFASHQRPNPTTGHIVAELSFGFWVHLLSGDNRYEELLWRPALHRAFPHYRGLRKPQHENLYHLNKLRNRIAHYEPIHHRDLATDREKIIYPIGCLSNEVAQWMQYNDRILDVLAERAEVCAALAPTQF